MKILVYSLVFMWLIAGCTDRGEVPFVVENGNIVLTCDILSRDGNDEHSTLSRLRAIGNEVVDDSCKFVILKGVAIIDPFFMVELEGGFKASDFESLKNDWNVNILRIPIHPDLYNNYPNYLEKYVDPIVEWGNRYGYYLLLSYHAHGNVVTGESESPDWKNNSPWRGNPYDSDKALAIRALQEMTIRYHNKPWVLYGSFNEPTYITWETWYKEAEQLVDVIHTIDDRALITVSGIDWGYNLEGALQRPVNRKNVVYETHPYPWKGENWKSFVPEIQKHYPVILGEWGFGETRGNGTKDNYGSPLIEFCNDHDIGRIAWIWHHEWTPAIFGNSGQALTPFGELVQEDLTP